VAGTVYEMPKMRTMSEISMQRAIQPCEASAHSVPRAVVAHVIVILAVDALV
jgi:hypothetical protein